MSDIDDKLLKIFDDNDDDGGMDVEDDDDELFDLLPSNRNKKTQQKEKEKPKQDKKKNPPAKPKIDIDKLFDPRNGFTAIFAANDHAAVDIANHAFKYNLRVPDDIAIIGFDNLDITSVFSPTISTIAQPFSKLGESAAELAYTYLTGESSDNIQKTLPVELIIRKSTKKIII